MHVEIEFCVGIPYKHGTYFGPFGDAIAKKVKKFNDSRRRQKTLICLHIKLKIRQVELAEVEVALCLYKYEIVIVTYLDHSQGLFIFVQENIRNV